MKALAVVVALAACVPAQDDTVVEVTRGDLVLAVTATGELAAVDSTDVKPPPINSVGSFKIAWLAPEGSTVAKGDPLVNFDTADIDRQLQSNRSDADAAQKRLELRREQDTSERARAGVTILEAEAAARKAALRMQVPDELTASIDRRELQFQSELADMALVEAKQSTAYGRHYSDIDMQSTIDTLASAKTNVVQLEADIAAMSVPSPRAGTVVYLSWGTTKRQVGADLWRLGTAVQVVGLDRMQGVGLVDEVDLPRVAVGQPIDVRLDAMPDVALHGRVESVGDGVFPRSNTDPSNVARMTFSIAASDAVLRPGMRFAAAVETARAHDVLQVPAGAVEVTADGPVCTLATGERVPVVVGRHSPDAVEIVWGLAEHDRVEVMP